MKFTEWVDKNNICIIMRGLPGGGKSHKVRDLLAKFGGDENHIFSADKYFENLAVEEFEKRHNRKPNEDEMLAAYKKVWHPSRLSAAHRWCFDQFKLAVDQGVTPVIVDNTNTTIQQMERYFKYAEDNEYKVRIEEPDSPWWKEARSELGFSKVKWSAKLKSLKAELLKRGKHGVPADAIEHLIDHVWQNIPGGTGKYLKYDQVFKKKAKSKH